MPVEDGIVMEIRGKRALVKTVRNDACAGCSSKGMCQTLGGSGEEVSVEANNIVGAREGDHVKIELSDSTFVSSSFFIYMVPILCLIIGLAVGDHIASLRGLNKDSTTLISGILFFAASVAVIYPILNRRAKKNSNYVPDIIIIVKESGE